MKMFFFQFHFLNPKKNTDLDVGMLYHHAHKNYSKAIVQFSVIDTISVPGSETHTHTHAHTQAQAHTHTRLTAQVSRYPKGITNLDFNEARDR